eukprot:TRINITY_DN17607_c0_g2_i1.p1 TRINITY_DN17607_c0_g2~~TRINITY_DN17607_c0_g2_i1.p1  ORF type:complete len:255 (-),score=36.32 TRINITY_DN17607_c0_g2_i1:88-852(-)
MEEAASAAKRQSSSAARHPHQHHVLLTHSNSSSTTCRQRAVSLVASNHQSPLTMKGAGDFDAWPAAGGGVGVGGAPPGLAPQHARERRSSIQPHQYPPQGIEYNAASSSTTNNTTMSASGPLSPLSGRIRGQPRVSQDGGAKKQSLSGFSSTSPMSPLSGGGGHQPSLSVVESGTMSKTRGDRRMSTKTNKSGEGIQFGDVTISYQEMASLKRIFETFDEDQSNSICLLYTSDAADEEDSVDLGGRRIIKKKKK